MCFLNSVLWKFFMILSWFEVWYVSPLNTWKQQDLGFACIQGVKLQIKKKSKKIPFKSYFLLQDLLFWQKAWYDTMYNFQKYVFEKSLQFGTL